ncbi:MAG: penicillin-binding protein 2 [Actinomycetales bacterium]|nr:penicillin-binding protein 2 [Tetrasphaera sp.]NLX00709.1 penicillin-binding protein 2 [Actinomycetales bacterium]
MRGILVLSTVIFSLFAAQLVRIQGLDASAVAAQAFDERNRTEVLPALRGQIVDRNGVVLAQSIERRTVTVDQTAVPEYTRRIDGVRTKVGVKGAAEVLSPLLGINESKLRKELTGTARYRIIAKNISVPTWRRIQALGIPGIYSERTTQRDYPQSTTAASLVGWVYADGQAGGGIEAMYDEVLHGVNGQAKYETSPNGRVIPNGRQVVEEALDGRKVELTINSSIQWYAQNALAAGVERFGAESGTVVVQGAKTGELLAVASYPSYDPNKIGSAKGSLDNRAFTQIFEPGSTNKIITMAAALQEGAVTPDQPVVVPNRLPRADRSFKDSHDHPTLFLTAAGVLAQSSNIGTILIGEQLDKETLESYFRSFGMGSKTGIGFPSESPGLVAPADKMSGSQRYTIMFGQGMSVTAIQSSSAFQTIANGGVRVEPTLVKAVEGEGGVMVPTDPPSSRRVVDTEVADVIMQMLEGAVSDQGSTTRAQIPGYRIAGKTGTADRYDDRLGRYHGKTASFVGMAPSDDPEIVVTVIVQKPSSGFFGSVVAAPIFKEVTTFALTELNIPPTGAEATPLKLVLDEPPSRDDPRVLGAEYLP